MKAMSAAASSGRHASAAVAEAILLVAVLAALAVGLAVATGNAPGGANSAFAARNSAVSLVVADGSFGGTTTATVGGSGLAAAVEAGQSMWVRVGCVLDADGSVGLVAWEKTGADGTAAFALGPTPSWQSGSAVCRAEAGTFDRHGRFRVAATTSFTVSE